jgi:uridine kinase
LTRDSLIERLVAAILSIDVDHPTRIAIDGRSAAGKTTLADDLALAIRVRGRDVLRSSIDDFYSPSHKYRSERDEWTPLSRYDRGYNYQSFVDFVLRPLGPDGSRRCRPALFDSYNDVWLPEEWVDVGADTIAIIDGAFLLRTELAGHWDYVIWLDIDIETMVDRARQRDVAWTGSEERVVERYRNLWIPTHLLYERLVEPMSKADLVIDNRDVTAPEILRFADPEMR